MLQFDARTQTVKEHNLQENLQEHFLPRVVVFRRTDKLARRVRIYQKLQKNEI